MAGPFDVMRGLRLALQSSGRVPEIETWSLQEFDPAGEDSRVQVPAVQMKIVSRVDNNNSNSKVRRVVRNEDGNAIGQIIHADFNMRVQIDIWDAAGATYDNGRPRNVSEMGQRIERELLRYDKSIRGAFLPDPDDPNAENSNGVLDTVEDITIVEGGRSDRIAGDPFSQAATPTLRIWQEEIRVDFFEEINTVEEYGEYGFIRKVNVPKDGDFEPGVEGVDIEYVPPTIS